MELLSSLQVVKGANPSSVSVILLNDERPLGNDTVLPAIFNQAASAKNPYIDVWFANITDQNVLNVFDLCVQPCSSMASDRLMSVRARVGSKPRRKSVVNRCRRATPTSGNLCCHSACEYSDL
jgi:hypothetical protein